MLNIADIVITAIGYEKEILTKNTFKNKKIFFLKINKIRNNLHEISLKKKLRNLEKSMIIFGFLEEVLCNIIIFLKLKI